MPRLLKSAAVACSLVIATGAHAEDLEFLLINDSSADVEAFYVSPASSNDWDDNLLVGGYLAPGYEIGVLIGDGLSTCVYDIRAEFSDASYAEDFQLDLCDLGEYHLTD